jgi:hypothetical protein
MTRRHKLRLAGVRLLALLAGCTSDNQEPPPAVERIAPYAVDSVNGVACYRDYAFSAFACVKVRP